MKRMIVPEHTILALGVLLFLLLYGAQEWWHNSLTSSANHEDFSTVVDESGAANLKIEATGIKNYGTTTYLEARIMISSFCLQNPGFMRVVIKHLNKPLSETGIVIPGQYTTIEEASGRKCPGGVFSGQKDVQLPLEGVLNEYPFDRYSLKSCFAFSTEHKLCNPPTVWIGQVQISNYMTFLKLSGPPSVEYHYCEEWDGCDRGLHLEVNLERRSLTRGLFCAIALLIMIGVAAMLAAVRKLEMILLSLMTFFFSAWSLRSGLNEFALGQGTFVDVFFLFLAVVLIVGSLVRIFLGLEQSTTNP